MNLKLAGTLTAAATLFAGQAFAATVVLDSFDTEQSAVSSPYPGSEASTTIAFGNGNGTRTLTATNTGGPSPVAATVLEATGGALGFSNKDQATGTATLSYSSLGDIELGDNAYFFFDVGYFDNVANFAVSATDSAGNVSTYSEVLAPGFNPYLYFADFDGAADFNDIANLTFTLDTTDVPGFGAVTSVDGSLYSISIGADDAPAPVPLPAAGWMLLAGIGGIAAMSKRKRAA